MKIYVETSAAAKLMVAEAETEAVATVFADTSNEFVSSTLLETEIRRIAMREGISQGLPSAVLCRISLYLPDADDYRLAGIMPGGLRSLDALHVQGALALRADAMFTYDTRVAAAAWSAGGLRVLAPAAPPPAGT